MIAAVWPAVGAGVGAGRPGLARAIGARDTRRHEH